MLNSVGADLNVNTQTTHSPNVSRRLMCRKVTWTFGVNKPCHKQSSGQTRFFACEKHQLTKSAMDGNQSDVTQAKMFTDEGRF